MWESLTTIKNLLYCNKIKHLLHCSPLSWWTRGLQWRIGQLSSFAEDETLPCKPKCYPIQRICQWVRIEGKRQVDGLAERTYRQSGKRNNKELSQDLRFQITVCSKLRPVNIWEFSEFCSFSILITCFNNFFLT